MTAGPRRADHWSAKERFCSGIDVCVCVKSFCIIEAVFVIPASPESIKPSPKSELSLKMFHDSTSIFIFVFLYSCFIRLKEPSL